MSSAARHPTTDDPITAGLFSTRGQGVHRKDHGNDRRTAGRAALLGLLTIACQACVAGGSVSFGEAMLVTPAGAEVQMLTPHRTTRVCTTSARGAAGASPPVTEALSRMLDEAPADAGLGRLQITWAVREFGLWRRECVETTADVVRPIRVISLPATGHVH